MDVKIFSGNSFYRFIIIIRVRVVERDVFFFFLKTYLFIFLFDFR